MPGQLTFDERVEHHVEIALSWAQGDVQHAYEGTDLIKDVEIRNAARDMLIEMGAQP